MSGIVFVSLGSNKGDSRSIFQSALADLEQLLGRMRRSSLYRTRPVGPVVQDDFLNMLVCGTYSGTPQQLLSRLQEIESRYGRNRSAEIRQGPRSLDLDIILFGEVVIESPVLSIPHPAMHNRQFVLVPLLELEPDITDPRTGSRFDTLKILDVDQGVVRIGALYGN